MTLQEAITIGIQHHQSGRFREAEVAYRQILSQQPDQPDALHLLGMLAHAAGRRDDAMKLIGRAITVSPNQAEFYGSLGLLLSEAGRLDEAIASYRKAISIRPDLAAAYNNLGNTLAAKQNFDEALAYLRQAMAIKPDYPDPAYNLGNVFSAVGRLPEAVASYRQAVALRPTWVQAHNNLGVVYKKMGDYEQAVASFEEALKLAPDYVPALNNLGDSLREMGQFDRAVGACRLAIQVRPNLPEAHNNLGNALCLQSRFEEAAAAYRQALALRPEFVEAQGNLGNVYHAQGDLDQAMANYRTAIAINPQYASAHWNIGLIHLTKGEYAEGWQEFEWRWRVDNIRLYGRKYKQPVWDGSSLSGRHLLLHADQGIGDAIFFLRYLPMVAQLGASVTLAAHSELLPLVRNVPGVSETVAILEPAPHCEVRCALMSLPLFFQTTVETIPAEPYLKADAADVEAWKARVPTDGRRKVGLVWANRPDPMNRCPKAEEFFQIAQTPGVWFTSLQKDRLGTTPPEGVEMTDWTKELNHLGDTAALIANLDLVITVDTAVAHLAGAMGKPTWLLLKKVPDWRWMLERTDSPWYPSMRLFRQKEMGEWGTVVGDVGSALRTFVG